MLGLSNPNELKKDIFIRRLYAPALPSDDVLQETGRQDSSNMPSLGSLDISTQVDVRKL